MPIESNGEEIQYEPSSEVKGPPTSLTHPNAQPNQATPTELEKDIKRGEWWLIRIGIATLLVNTIIALIYWGQLEQMRKATVAATTASNTASDTLAQMQDDSVTSSTQFDTQLAKLDASVKQASRLAKATEEANRNVLESERPWMGVNSFVIQDWVAGKNPTVGFIFTNTGRRPGYAESIVTHAEVLQSFPSDPETKYFSSGVPSKALIMPGASQQSASKADGVLTQDMIDALDKGPFIYFVFGKIIYRDVVTGKTHWTHVCYRYHPEQTKEFLSGFRQCDQYNDTDDN